MKKAFIQLHIAILLAGFTGVLGRLITFNEGLLVWYRMFFSSMTLLAMSSIYGNFPRAGKNTIFRLLATGSLVAIHWIFFYGSIKYANVSVALVCFSAVGFFTAWIEPLVFRRSLDIRELVLGLVVMVGIGIIFQFDPRYRTGIILGVISSLLAAVFTVLNKKWLSTTTSEALTFYEILGGCLAMTLILPAYTNVFPPDHWIPTTEDLFWLLFLSIVCTVFAFRLSIDALKKISPFTVNLSYNLEPLYGILLAFLLFGENQYLSYHFYIGISLIIFTVVVQSRWTWKKRDASGGQPVIHSSNHST